MSDFHPSVHGLLDLYDCDAVILRDAVALEQILRHAAHLANARILFSHFHTFGGHGGVTGVLLLAESHISIHTWAEHGLATVDIFLCGHRCADVAADYIATALTARHKTWHTHRRGFNV